MRFSALPVHSFEDATLDLEQLQTLLTSPSGQTLPFLQLLVAANLRLAFGGKTFNGAATNVVSVTVATGLPGNVNFFCATSASTPTAGQFFIGDWANAGAGSVTCQALLPFGNFTAGTNNYSFNWIALG